MINKNYLKLPGSYLFSTIGKKVNAYAAAHPDKKIIRLGIGDVTQPLSPAVKPAAPARASLSLMRGAPLPRRNSPLS